MESKSNKGLVITLIITILLVLGLGGYIVYDKFLANTIKEKEMKKEDNTIKEEKLDLDDDSISILYTLDRYIYQKSRKDGLDNFSAKELGSIALNGISKDDLTKTNKKDPMYGNNGNNLYSLQADKIIESLKYYFGSDIEINKNDIGSSKGSIIRPLIDDNNSIMYIYSYDKNNDIYLIGFAGGLGGSPGNIEINQQQTISAVKRDDTITVIQKVIYLDGEQCEEDMEFFEHKIFSDPEKKKLIDTKKIKSDDSTTEIISVKDYEDEAGTITITLKKDKNLNTYVFVSSIIS